MRKDDVAAEVAKLDAMREQLLEEVAAIDATISVLRNGQSASDLVSTILTTFRGRVSVAAPRGAGVGADKLAQVREYVQKHGRVRQSDVARDLDLNSGTVSVALHALQMEGEVENTNRKENRSLVWESATKK